MWSSKVVSSRMDHTTRCDDVVSYRPRERQPHYTIYWIMCLKTFGLGLFCLVSGALWITHTSLHRANNCYTLVLHKLSYRNPIQLQNATPHQIRIKYIFNNNKSNKQIYYLAANAPCRRNGENIDWKLTDRSMAVIIDCFRIHFAQMRTIYVTYAADWCLQCGNVRELVIIWSVFLIFGEINFIFFFTRSERWALTECGSPFDSSVIVTQIRWITEEIRAPRNTQQTFTLLARNDK